MRRKEVEVGEEAAASSGCQYSATVNSEQREKRGRKEEGRGLGFKEDAWLHSPKHGKPKLASTCRRSL